MTMAFQSIRIDHLWGKQQFEFVLYSSLSTGIDVILLPISVFPDTLDLDLLKCLIDFVGGGFYTRRKSIALFINPNLTIQFHHRTMIVKHEEAT
ncbi:hypothetical protein DERF_000789 [Dermatophagoides farinae]|uniref:Uncharacterized protein n=1 Tax=Dermatophagoides farinae TaxID=6954 RepID=A0A922IAX3_DERFA|nr:hypothetical protein DERF_000789 [Dermatophagoides farinae]